MDRQERSPDQEEILRRFFEALQSSLWTSIPAIVYSVDRANLKCAARPSIRGFFPNGDGTYSAKDPPLIQDCHLVLLGGGGMFIEVPLAQGDEVLLTMSARAIDTWYANGGLQNPSEIGRMHDLSDAFALPGIRSKPRMPGVAMDANVFRIRTDANDAYFEFNPAAKSVNIHAPGGITLNGVTIDTNGNIANAGTYAGGDIHSSGIVNADSHVQVGGTTLNVP